MRVIKKKKKNKSCPPFPNYHLINFDFIYVGKERYKLSLHKDHSHVFMKINGLTEIPLMKVECNYLRAVSVFVPKENFSFFFLEI